MDTLLKNFKTPLIYHHKKEMMINYTKCSMLIPRGIKYFVWFTLYNNNPICIFLPIKDNKIQKCIHKYVCFEESLCINGGTILYGTLVNTHFFF